MSKLRSINGTVVLKPIETTEETIGNIIVPDMGKERPEMGEVVDVNPTYNWHIGQFVPSQLKVGDKVLIPKMGAQKITVSGDEYFLTKETDVIAVVED